MATRPVRVKSAAVRGFTLNVSGAQQLNYDVMRQNLIDEITQPLDERRNIDVGQPQFLLEKPRHQASQSHNTHQTLRLVFDKRVVDPNTFMSLPYGFTQDT